MSLMKLKFGFQTKLHLLLGSSGFKLAPAAFRARLSQCKSSLFMVMHLLEKVAWFLFLLWFIW